MSVTDSVLESRADPARRSTWLAVRVVVVRLRFLLLLAAVLLLVGAWPTLRGYWERLTRPTGGPDGAMSLNLEYWCPMCPGVVSDRPGKCPVCNMILVRREKGEAVPLPEGVVARMQFSPYRVQLAGIRTAAVEYRPLRRDMLLVGTVAGVDSASVSVDAEVFEKDVPFLAEGSTVQAASDLLPGHVPFTGTITGVEPERALGSRSFHVRMQLDDPGRELRAGTLVTARLDAALTRLAWWRRSVAEAWKDRAAAEVAVRVLLAPAAPAPPGGGQSSLCSALMEVLNAQGLCLAVPHGAVVDHGARKVAFVESGPGMFDAVEMTLGPRCGDYYPVLRGVEAGQRVAVAGAFLLDAEMWLNHGVAASYFGATRSARAAPADPAPQHGPLSVEDQALAARQKVCPVTDEPLDAMGGPVRVTVEGRSVFLCCTGCEAPLRKNPAKYLAKLPEK
jgi:hypothetical protein